MRILLTDAARCARPLTYPGVDILPSLAHCVGCLPGALVLSRLIRACPTVQKCTQLPDEQRPYCERSSPYVVVERPRLLVISGTIGATRSRRLCSAGHVHLRAGTYAHRRDPALAAKLYVTSLKAAAALDGTEARARDVLLTWKR
jgi:hypothetical protein